MELLNWVKEYKVLILMFILMLFLFYGIYVRDNEITKLREKNISLMNREELTITRHCQEREYLLGFRKMLLDHLGHYGTIHGELVLSDLYPGQAQEAQHMADQLGELIFILENHPNIHRRVEHIVGDLDSILDKTLYLNALYVAARKAKNGST